MTEAKKLAYETPVAEVIEFPEDSFLATSSNRGRVCNFDVCFGDGRWTCTIDWIFGP